MATVLAVSDRPEHYLRSGQQLLAEGDVDGATRAIQQAVHLDPSLGPAYSALARAFLQGGFIDNAIQHFVRAARLGGLGPDDEPLLQKALRARHHRAWEMLRARTVLGLPVLRFLGAGWEGANYLALGKDGVRVVVKAFHPAFVRLINYDGLGGVYRKPVLSARHDLERLATLPDAGAWALHRVRPIEADGRIAGVTYPYEYLLPLHGRCLGMRGMRLAIMGTFFRTQAYLLERFRLCLSDAWATRQFMLSLNGRPRYVDYGTTIIPIDDFRCREDHWEVLAAVELLYSVFEPRKEPLLSGVRVGHGIGCVAALGAAARRHRFVRELLHQLERGRLEAFSDPAFYRHLGRRLPVKAGVAPRLIAGAGVLRRRIGI